VRVFFKLYPIDTVVELRVTPLLFCSQLCSSLHFNQTGVVYGFLENSTNTVEFSVCLESLALQQGCSL